MVPAPSRLARVMLFARAPRLGSVKTRLAADIGDERALRVYRELGSAVVRQTMAVAKITVWYDPPDAVEEMRSWMPGLRYRPQPRGDLGVRLAAAFDEHFRENPDEPAVAIGTDAPDIDAGVIGQATRALETHDIVLGPAADGGYYLIGMTHPMPELFHDIAWGTQRVFAETLAACVGAGSSPATLAQMRDVDRLADLAALGLESP